MGLGLFFFDKVLKKPYYKDVQFGLLTLNWVVQRIFGINRKVKYSVNYTTKINGAKNLELKGKDPLLSIIVSGGCYFSCHESKIIIGKKTIFAHNVTIVSNNHDPIDRNVFINKPVVIGENCWLGAGVTILPGVVLGDNVSVGANSVVTKSFESNVVIAGNPAVVIKKI